MRLIDPHQIVVDQFTEPRSTGGRRPRLVQFILLVPALAVAFVAWKVEATLSTPAALLTATSILTGFTFTMALRIWERSIEARTTPGIATDGPRLLMLDQMRAHLIWTVFVGVVATSVLVLIAIFVSGTAPTWVTALVAGLVTYQIMLVVGALARFYEASYALRH